MAVLEKLCEKFTADRGIILEKKEDSLYSKQGRFELIYSNLIDFEILGLSKDEEFSTGMISSLLPNPPSKELVIEIRAGCLIDYLTQLEKSNNSFAQIVREKFEGYLGTIIDPDQKLNESFNQPSYIGFMSVLNAFYPK